MVLSVCAVHVMSRTVKKNNIKNYENQVYVNKKTEKQQNGATTTVFT